MASTRGRSRSSVRSKRPPAREHPGRRLVASTLDVLGVLSAVAALAVTLAARVPAVVDAIAMAGAFSAYGPQLAALAALLLVGGRLLRHPGNARSGAGRRRPRRLGIAAAVALTLVLLAVQAPHWIPDRRPASGDAGFTLVSLNVHLGDADPATIAAATADADVVVFTEFTNATAAGLADTPFAARFRYALDVTLPNRGAEGTMVYARWPLGEAQAISETTVHQNWSTTVAVPRLGEVTVVGVHAQRPFLDGTDWRVDHDTIVAGLPRGPRTVVAGDFNAAPDQVSVPGLTSAVDVVGAGWLTTFPVNPVVPRLLRIDHVLLGSGLTAASVGTVAVDGTDHLGLRTVVRPTA